MEMSKDIHVFQTLGGVRISWPWKGRGGSLVFYTTRRGIYIWIWFSTTSDMKADQNDRRVCSTFPSDFNRLRLCKWARSEETRWIVHSLFTCYLFLANHYIRKYKARLSSAYIISSWFVALFRLSISSILLIYKGQIKIQLVSSQWHCKNI